MTSKYSVPYCHSIPLNQVTYLDPFLLLQGCRDVGPEGEEGEGLGEQSAPSWGFKDATGGVEQPGQQPPAQPPT